MTLPTSGPLRFSAINTELKRSSTAQMSLKTAETGGYIAINQNSTSKPNGLTPYKVSEWYGYNQDAAGSQLIKLAFSRLAPATGTARVYKNGVLFLSRTTSGITNGTIVNGDTFYASIITSFSTLAYLRIYSSVRGELYYYYDYGSNTSDTFTCQSGETITVDITVESPPI